ncbi:DNA methyltransferase [Mesorhizobium sp. M4A.F.Ca.ET.050.02.1.1]|uniref:DNA methyltransferase n=1 Tax=Mesorhizobium sp. M4A.F.Ca.ET.050.02.1.1 TaxID=2496754 RepID=UPI00167E427B|nr:DNA methyltransferase [Mesorhizobium sp. M4A.F.Ca.ET.050.02.1.1]
MNELHFGDNLDVLRAMPAESVNLIYLDPPFNSNANYNVLYGTKHGGASKAQSHAFEDTWTWGRDAQRALDDTAERHLEAGALLDAFQKVFPTSNMMAYLAMMAVRLIEMHRVLKPTGSLYLHCDPTASHYLKILLDSIFSVRGYVNEIAWKRYGAHNDVGQGSKHFGRVHDTLLFYSKSDDRRWTQQFTPLDPKYVEETYRLVDEKTGERYTTTPLTGPGGAEKGNPVFEWNGHTRAWRYSKETMQRLHDEGRLYYSRTGYPRKILYLSESQGVPAQSIWADIPSLSGAHKERIGYPTQKPLALLDRIILTSSNAGDVVLDPFCGCGTAIESAQRLGRRWIGIDVTYLAIHVIENRLVKAFKEPIKGEYKLFGRPQDADDALALAARDWLEFQKWAVLTLGGLPKEKPGADGGIDGIIRYHQLGSERAHRAIVSVKGGLNVGVDAIHKLKSVVDREGADIGVLVCVNPPTAPMVREAASMREVGPASRKVQRIQIVTIDQLFQAGAVQVPGMLESPEVIAPPPPAKRGRKRVEGQTEMLFPIEGAPEIPKRKGNRQIRPVEIEVTRSAYTRKVK